MKILERQGYHLAALSLLLAGVALLARLDGALVGTHYGHSTGFWFVLAIFSAIAHQVYVLFAWRLELHHKTLTRTFGDAAFPLFAAVFLVLLVSRLVLIAIVAEANQDTVDLPRQDLRSAALILAVPAVYLFYSVARYWGFARPMGLDHFDPKYRELGLVREGIFRFTPNGMYVFGLLLLWFPGLWNGSKAALIAAAFHHTYIWVHFYCTEKPNMRKIYGP